MALTLHVDEVLEHLIDRDDDLGVSLEPALGDDKVRELVAVDVHARLLRLDAGKVSRQSWKTQI